MLQVFIQNSDEGEPWALCGAYGDYNTNKAIAHFIDMELENSVLMNDKELSIEFKLVDMTKEEVLALPEI